MSEESPPLKEINDKIMTYLSDLKKQRDELHYLIEKQLSQKKELQIEIERLTYKLKIVNPFQLDLHK